MPLPEASAVVEPVPSSKPYAANNPVNEPEGDTLTEAVVELAFNVAVTVTVWLVVTVPAVAVKFAAVAPAATVADPGTDSAALFEERVTADPPAGAACDKVTVQFEVPPDRTADGEHCKPETVVTTGAVAVTEAVCELPFTVAVTVAV